MQHHEESPEKSQYNMAILGERERGERERERERETERERDRDRQRDRQTDRQRQTERETESETERERVMIKSKVLKKRKDSIKFCLKKVLEK